MTKITRRFMIVIVLAVGMVINGCGASKKTVTFKTEIKNASNLTAYNLDFENGETQLLLIPIERFQTLEFTIATLPGTNDRIVLPDADKNEFVSIPLTQKIDVELVDIKLGTYLLAVNFYRVSNDFSGEIGPMVLMLERNGVQGLYALDIKEENDQLTFDPGPTFLAISK